ncbi:hypothetical protein LTR95_006249 [Oleoguttula sp. CCFEE 5521]
MEAVSRRARSVEIVDELEWAMPQQDWMKRKMSGVVEDGPAPSNVALPVAPRRKQTSPSARLATATPSKKRKIAGIDEHGGVEDDADFPMALHQAKAAYPRPPMHLLLHPVDHGDTFWPIENDMKASVMRPIQHPRQRVPSSPESPHSSIRT